MAPNRRNGNAVGHQPAALRAREVGICPPTLVVVVGRTGREFGRTQGGCGCFIVEPVEKMPNECVVKNVVALPLWFLVVQISDEYFYFSTY